MDTTRRNPVIRYSFAKDAFVLNTKDGKEHVLSDWHQELWTELEGDKKLREAGERLLQGACRKYLNAFENASRDLAEAASLSIPADKSVRDEFADALSRDLVAYLHYQITRTYSKGNLALNAAAGMAVPLDD